jgi:hypothetical protein
MLTITSQNQFLGISSHSILPFWKYVVL